MRNRNLALSLLALCVAALVGMTACGGGGGSTTCTTNCTPPPAATGVTIYPGGNGAAVSMAAGSMGTFTAYAGSAQSGVSAPVNVNWAASSGTITGNGTSNGAFTAPATAGTVTITATDLGNMNLGGTVTVNVTAAPANGLLVNPGATQVAAGSTTAFAATQNGNAVTPAVWQVNGASGGDSVHGTITGTGSYTAPLTPPPSGSTTITACLDGGCTTTATASVAVVFSNASFNGPYAFSYTGDDGTGFLGVAGHITADGQGNIGTDGVEDEVDININGVVSTNGVVSADTLIGGGSTYTVGPDGRVQIDLATGEVLQVSLTSGQQGGAAQHGVMIRFDSGATASGTIDAQDTAALAAGFNGNYVFGVSGVDFNDLPLVQAGRFMAVSASLSIPSGSAEQDINDANTLPTTNPDTSLTGSFAPDANAATNGRGEVSFNSTNSIFIGQLGGSSVTTVFAYYIVDSTHLKVVEIDANLITTGDFFLETQGNGPYNAAILDNANYAFTAGGSGSNGPFAAGGVLVSGGTSGAGSTSGSVTGGVYDNNYAGSANLDLPVKSGSYTVDSLGRIDLSLTVNTTSLTYVGYAGTYNGANGPANVVELIDETNGFVDGGLAYEQTAANTPSGSYALDMSGVANGASNGGEQDIEGQIATGMSGVLNGSVDINNIANGFTPASSVTVTSSSITTVGTDGRGTPLTIHTSSPGTNFPLAYYVVDDNTTLLLETDGQRVLTGVLLKQY